MLSNRQLRAALTRGAWIIVTFAVITATCAAVVSALLPERHAASQELAVVSPLISASGVVQGDGNQTRLLSTIAALLVSDSVLQKAADATGSSRGGLKDKVAVSTDTNSDLVTVSITSESAARAEQEVEAIVSAAQQTELSAEQARLEAALAGVDQELAAAAVAAPASGTANRAVLETVRANVSAALAALTSSIQPVADVTTREAAGKLSPPMASALGALAGLLLGTAVVVLRTRFRSRVIGAEDVRALGLPVLAGPDESSPRAAQRVSNMWRTGPVADRRLVLVHVGRRAGSLEDSIVALWQRSDEPLFLVEVDGDGQTLGGSVGREGSGLTTFRVSEDDVFSSEYEKAINSTSHAWVLINVSGSDQVLVRACSEVGSALLVVRQGEPTNVVVRIADALKESNIAVGGVIVVGRQADRKRRAHRDSPALADSN